MPRTAARAASPIQKTPAARFFRGRRGLSSFRAIQPAFPPLARFLFLLPNSFFRIRRSTSASPAVRMGCSENHAVHPGSSASRSWYRPGSSSTTSYQTVLPEISSASRNARPGRPSPARLSPAGTTANRRFSPCRPASLTQRESAPPDPSGRFAGGFALPWTRFPASPLPRRSSLRCRSRSPCGSSPAEPVSGSSASGRNTVTVPDGSVPSPPSSAGRTTLTMPPSIGNSTGSSPTSRWAVSSS